jgi:hypothetical protein
MKKKLLVKTLALGIIILFIGISLVEVNAVSSVNEQMNRGLVEVIDQQQIENCHYGWNFFDPWWLAQGFTPALPILTKVQLYLFAAGNPPINVKIMVSIRASLNGNDLATATINGSDVYGEPFWFEFNFSDIDVTPSHIYYILCRVNGGSDGNCYCWVFDENNPYHGGDAWKSESGSNWYLLDTPDHPLTDCCFKTYGLEEQPNIPEITGQSYGNTGQTYNYTFLSTDPDGNILYYFVDWGDGINSEWLGPYTSGQQVTISHVWIKRGSYIVKAKVKDAYGVESEWGIFEVTMPRNRALYYCSLFLRFLKQFPDVFLILRYVVKWG